MAVGLRDYIHGGYSCIHVETTEYETAPDKIVDDLITADKGEHVLALWKVTEGTHAGTVSDGIDGVEESRTVAEDLPETLKWIMDSSRSTALIIYNIHEFIDNPVVQESLLDAALKCRFLGSFIFLVGPYFDLPPTLQAVVTRYRLPLPTQEELADLFSAIALKHSEKIFADDGDSWSDHLVGDDDEGWDLCEWQLDMIQEAARYSAGLDQMGAENAFCMSIASAKKLDLALLQSQKAQEVAKSDILEFILPSDSLDNVGGFSALKAWLERRQRVFSKEAREYGLPYPRGMLIAGIPGCLSGDERIKVSRRGHKGVEFMSLRQLYKGFISGNQYKTLSLDDTSGAFVWNDIEQVTYTGVKPVYEVMVDYGFTVRATEDHKLYAPVGGWLPLSEFHGGDDVLLYRYGRKEEHCIKQISYVDREATYDITMRAPHNSFVANDFVVHNSGKTLVALATGLYLKLPVLRLDMGKVFRSLVGSSEAAMRTALSVAEAVSPAVLFIDEIDKALAGHESSGSLDSGVTSRVLGTLLTWRSETQAPVMLVATANNVKSLPSMVYRKGRLDELWSVDLPSPEERIEIFNIHLRKRGREPENFDVPLLAQKTEDWVGSEIEAAIEDAMFFGFDEDREFTTEDVLTAIKATVPQVKRVPEEIEEVRTWAESRARPVSLPTKKKNGKSSKVRKLGSAK